MGIAEFLGKEGTVTGVQEAPIDVLSVLEAVRDPSAGAVVIFVGTVRDLSEGRAVSSLEFEAAPEMARHQLDLLALQAKERFQLVRCGLVHRLGRLEVGEVIVVAAASAPHRRAAFDAVEWLIDQLKRVVPIWKKEHYQEGSARWVDPGCEMASEEPKG